ncbi:hypothetical protein B0H10DRAFT_2064390 [Mycena sp. CBHHK59/15]|nr:hypothetical protein B0H10DRAFT_2064390 [Mycena sp. CBHHK59/15]
MSSGRVNGPDPDSARVTTSTSIEDDIAQLNQLLSQESLDNAEEASVAELLARLESADGVTKGVESKLDALLGNLDSLLETLEKEGEPVRPDSSKPTASQSTDNET